MSYSLVIDTSGFKPFDINVPLGVLRDYRDAYYKREDTLLKIAEDIGDAQIPEPEYGNTELEKIYDQYMKYQDDLRNASDDFSRGMNWKNSALISAINRRYGTEVKPIKQAVENYNKFMENKNTIRANKQARFGKDPSVYDFVGGRIPLLEVLDAKDIQTGAAAMMKGLSSVIKDNPEIRKSIMEGYDLYMSGGLSQSNAEALIQALNDYNERTNFKHNDAVLKYMSALNSYYDTLGVDNWDESEKKKVWNDVVVGAMSAMPERKEEMYLKLDLERAYKKASIASTYENIAASRQSRYESAQLQPYKIRQAKANLAKTNAEIRQASKQNIEDANAEAIKRNFNKSVRILLDPNSSKEAKTSAREYINTYNSIYGSTSKSNSNSSKNKLNFSTSVDAKGGVTLVQYYVIPREATGAKHSKIVKVNINPDAKNPVDRIKGKTMVGAGSTDPLTPKEVSYMKNGPTKIDEMFLLDPSQYDWVLELNTNNQADIDAVGTHMYNNFIKNNPYYNGNWDIYNHEFIGAKTIENNMQSAPANLGNR